MDKQTLVMLNDIFRLCIVPLLGVLTSYLVAFLKKKGNELSAKTDSELEAKYMTMLSDTIVNCVVATNQTYVDALKNQNAFTKEAQLEAFNRTKESVMALLSKEAKDYLSALYSDLDKAIQIQIEAAVKVNKD